MKKTSISLLSVFHTILISLCLISLLEIILFQVRDGSRLTGYETFLFVCVSQALASCIAVLLTGVYFISVKLLSFVTHHVLGQSLYIAAYFWALFSLLLLMNLVFAFVGSPFDDPDTVKYIPYDGFFRNLFVILIVSIVAWKMRPSSPLQDEKSVLLMGLELSINATFWVAVLPYLFIKNRWKNPYSLLVPEVLFGLGLAILFVILNLNYHMLLNRAAMDYHRATSYLAIYYLLNAVLLFVISRERNDESFRKQKRFFLVAMLWVISTSFMTMATLEKHQKVKTNALTRTEFLKAEFGIIKTLLDFDHDGYISQFGGSDPDNFRSAILPFTQPVPGERPEALLIENPLPSNPKTYSIKRVLLITVDTVRKDHLASYGYSRPTTSHLDRLAADSIVFERAYAQSSATMQSVPSLLSGRYFFQGQSLFEYPNILRILRQQGWAAAVFPITAFTQGQLVSDPNDVDPDLPPNVKFLRNSDEITQQGIQFISEHRDESSVLWLHYYNPHSPYMFRSQNNRFGDRPIDRYDHNIAYEDKQIGRVLSWLREENLYEDTLIVFTSDHGEAFGEHGWRFHGINMFEYLINVPLFMKIPGVKPYRSTQPTMLTDILPTLLYYLNVRSTMLFNGLPVQDPPDPAARFRHIFSFCSPYTYMAIEMDWKIVWHRRVDAFELYNLTEDPKEQINLIDQYPIKALQLKGLLFTWLSQCYQKYRKL